MKTKLGFVAGLVLAASLLVAPLAVAQAPAQTCSQAIDQLANARAMPVGDVATKQVALDKLRVDQIPLDAAEAQAKKNLDAFDGDPTLEALTLAFNTARDAATAGKTKIVAAEKALAADQKLVADRDAAIKAGDAAVNKACKGADGVVTTPPVPVVTFADCAAVRAAGKAPLPANQPGYRTGLDSDLDGIACEVSEGTSVPIPSSINTGYAL